MDVFGGAPRFLAYPRPLVVQGGTDAVLKCQIAGDPRPAVIWERANKQLHPDGRYRLFEDGNVYNLIISRVGAEDSGQYICKAKNSIGETYAAATLKVEGEAPERALREENKPHFLIKPLSVRVSRSEDAVFSCKLWGKPRPEIIWEKDGKKLNDIFESAHFSIGHQDGGWFQLKIFQTRAPDAGVYICRARNEHGEALAGAVLLVDVGPEHEEEAATCNGYVNGHWKHHQGKRGSRLSGTHNIEEPAPNSAKVKMFTVSEGKHAKFRCYVTGKPKPEIVWRKDGVVIMSGRRYLLYEDREGYFTLKVLYCKQQDNGLYVCAASNTAGQTLSAVHLNVKEPAVRFKQPLNDVEVRERELAVLECEVSVDSVPTTWYLEDRRLQPGAKYGIEQCGTVRRLTIRDIGADDDGIYLCEMADGGRSIAEVSVRGTIMRKLPRKVDLLEGENAAFCVEVEEEEMDIHWYKDGLELRETHQTILKSFGKTHILVFVNATPQDSGIVTFVVGRSKTSSQLRVKAVRQSPPSCPVGVQMNTERSNSVLLSWVPAHDSRKNPPTGYVLERQEVGSQEWLQCLTTDLASAVEILGDSVPSEADYRFRICSVNKYGRSGHVEFSSVVHLVPVARIKTPLQDVLVSEGKDAEFSIELSALVIGTWFLNGSQIQEDERYTIHRSRTEHSLHLKATNPSDNRSEITFIAYGVRDSAMLYVQPTPVKFESLPEMDRNKKIEAGSPIVLYCELSDANAQVHWYKDGVELHTQEGIHVQSEGTMRRLVIQSADFSHSGEYRCDAIDDVLKFNVEVEAPRVKFAALSLMDRHKNIESGSPIELCCELSNPNTQVCWYKDGMALHPQDGFDIQSEGTKRKLVIQSAEASHSGVYSCDAVDDVIKFNVDVEVAPPVKFAAVSEMDHHKSIESGSPIELCCELSNPNTRVRWYKDGTELHPQEGFDIQSVGSTRRLVIQSAEVSHSGVYCCDAVDDVIKFNVDVEAPPVKFAALSETDRNKSIESGSPIELSCELSNPNTRVRWYKDGTELHPQEGFDIQSEGSTRRLVIQSAEVSHSGVYCCDAVDDVIKFNVDIEAPPVKFNPLPEADLHKSIVESSPVVLYCQVSRPDATVRWYKDGIEIQPSDGITVQSDKTMRRLVIQSSKLSDSGVYTCHAVDDAVVFNVNIREPPVTVVHPRGDVHLEHQVSEQIVLSCELSRSNAAVHWYKDGQELLESDDVILESEGPHRRLIILQGRTENSGEYVCDTADDSIFYQVTVTEPAVQIVSPSQSPMVLEFLTEECVVLSCEVSRPNADVRWYQDGLELEETEDLILETEGVHRRLIIPKAAVQDSAEYICDAVDDSVTFMVKITEPPVKFVRPHKAPGTVKVFVGDPVVLECEVSHSNAKVSWRKEGQEMEDSREITIEEVGVLRRLTIHSPKLEDSGNYFCNAKDETMDFRVKVTEAPVQIKRKGELKTQQQVMVSDDVVLECELSRANGTIKWYKDGEKIIDNERICLEEEGAFRSLVILNAETSDSGEYFCDACDDSVVFHVCVKEPPVTIIGNSDSPEHHSLIAGDDLVLSCELSRSNATVEWYCNGKPLSSEDSRICIETIGSVRQLVISGLRPSDSAEYICNAGDDKMVTTVTVKEPPVQILNKEDAKESIDVVENDSVTLCARVSKEDAAVQWLKNWRDISGERYSASSDGKSRLFSIRKVQLSDSGVYTCDAFSDEIHFTLQVKAAPIKFERKQEKPEDVFATETENTIMSAVVSSDKSEVKWLRHQSQIFDSDKYETRVEGRVHSLIVKNTSKEDCGMYTCISQDDEMVFVVSVKELKLSFVRSLEEVYAYKDDTIILRCEICKPKGDVQWLKDGQQILPSRHLAMKAEGRERSLTIHRATGNDTGEYVCESKDDKTCARVTVEMPRVVEVIAELHNVTVLEGEDATLKCVVSPEDAKLVWHRNGSVVVPDDKFVVSRKGLCHTLTIRDCQLTDSSKVTAEAEGVVSKANLQVQEAQVLFTKKMEAVIAEEHGEATLEVEVSLESGEVQWMRQGVVIQPSPKFTLSAKGRKRSLTVHSLTFSDRGTFRCETLHDRTQGKLNVEPRKISIRKGMTDTETLERETASFEVEVSHVDVQGVWQKDGIRIKPNNNWRVSTHGRVHALTLSNLTLEDSGTVTFSAESVRTSARLTVKEPPVMFLRALEDLRIPESSGASLECELSRQNADVKWLKNGEELKPGKNYRIYSMGRKRFLQITKCGIADSGTYTCDAVDSKVTAVLDVYERDVEIVQGLQDAIIQEDENAVFMCEVSVEDVKGEWLRNWEKIRPTSNVRIRQEGNKHFLLICNVKAEDSGKITFVAKQAESTANLEVEELPVQIVKPLRDKTALEKHRVILECTVSNPRCSVRWYQGETLILPSDHYEICSEGCYRKLVIQHVTAMDEGTYSVQVGEHESSARLLVEEQAILVVRQLEDVEVKAPEEARFECEISVPIVKPPQWSLNGEPLQNGNGVRMESAGTVHRLILKETSSEMVGIVKFTTGKARTSARLSIKC
ncbi:obscurin-like isoform X1 [Acipenser oxyrinchus oxyrinchus]|uniref:Obscurin-like protein 1 n=1 Tax=Acipenser oxyrinchus oxyrinchus TaxID=40147 RepID=A0AAD8DAM5_ACIOX|nr:obscurin-like isoform X1 [Acipenser oxyrinchus oxyrinchus]